jgi:hypothetical protein
VNPALLALLAAQHAARQRIVEAFERTEATSPTTARPLGTLGELDDAALRACIDDGTIREGAPGTFYLYVRPPTPRLGWGRLAKTIAFWIVLLLIPIAVLQLLNP